LVTDLTAATPEKDVLRLDICDRAPIFKLVKGCAALLGGFTHAMQPYLGHGNWLEKSGNNV
jgi:hypothetical protein